MMNKRRFLFVLAIAIAIPICTAGATVGCSSGDSSSSPEPAPSPEPTANVPKALTAFAASDETKKTMGVVKWTLSHFDRNATHGSIEGADASGAIIVTFEVTKTEKGVKTHFIHGSAQGDLEVQDNASTTNTLPAEAIPWSKLAHADLESFMAKEGRPYTVWGCISGIAWTVGGGLLSIPACSPGPQILVMCTGTILAGPVAGGAAVIDQCF